MLFLRQIHKVKPEDQRAYFFIGPGEAGFTRRIMLPWQRRHGAVYLCRPLFSNRLPHFPAPLIFRTLCFPVLRNRLKKPVASVSPARIYRTHTFHQSWCGYLLLAFLLLCLEARPVLHSRRCFSRHRDYHTRLCRLSLTK